MCGQNAFFIGLLALIAGTTSLAVTAAHAGNGSKLVFLKLQADAGIGALTQTAAEDAVETQLNQAAPDRGWELVSLGRVMGL